MNFVNNYTSYLNIIRKSSLETLRIWLQHQESDGLYNLNHEVKTIFFILSFGRSGTQFFSRLLNIDPSSTVVHEPLTRDFLEHARSFSDTYDYDKYINFRIKYIQAHLSNKNIKTYGEVNSLLRRHARAIMTVLPNVKVFYLIRDGRDVVRSMMTRGAMTNSWFYNQIGPQRNDPYFNTWHAMNQFEKCCWLWASENSLLYNQLGRAMKFELLLSDYEYFKVNLMDVLKLDICKNIWEKERLIKSGNRTIQFKCEPYEKWPAVWKDAFWEICGDIMQKHGYCENNGVKWPVIPI